MRRLPSTSFLQGKVGYQIAPSSDPASPAHLWFMVASPGPDRTVPRTVRPPRGRLWGWEGPFPSANPPLPARPAGGRAVTGVGSWAAGQAEKKEDPLQDPPNQSRESRGENLSPLALFPPVSREKRGPPPGRRPTGRCAPRPVKAPTTRRVRSTAPFPRPVPGGNPRGRSGPAMVPTEPPTDGAAPQGRSKGQGLPAPSPRQ